MANIRHYNNFKLTVYCVAQILERIDLEALKKHYEFIEKYVGLDKVYLEPYREGHWVDKDKMAQFIEFFKSKNVEVAGGFTTVVPDIDEEDKKRQRLFGTFCYTNKKMRDYIKKVSEYCAEQFDEVILDDFYFTNCTCEDCLKAKGDKTWVEFRKELMKDVSENLVVGPAKKINPGIKMIIKFPNWRESYHATGYRPDVEKDIFDMVYTGTETRASAYQDQHLPTYLSYSLVRWMDEASNGRNHGTWFDTYQCWPIDDYLEQGYLSAFAKPEEITLFQWTDLVDNKLVTPLGLQLGRIDKMLDKTGNPVGIPAYIPYASQGENHIEDFLGMQGFALNPTPVFPANGQVLLTQSSLQDPEIFDKLKELLLKGGVAYVTTGFAMNADKEKWEELSSAYLTGRKLNVTRYYKTDDPAGYLEDVPAVLFADVQHSNNLSWSLLNGGAGEYHTTLFLKDTYGKGQMYLLNVPENPSDLARIPSWAYDAVKPLFNYRGVYVTGNNVSIFHYDNDTFILYAHVTGKAHPVHTTIHLQDENAGITHLFASRYFGEEKELDLTPGEARVDFTSIKEKSCDLILNPGEFYEFRIHK
ncbi:hypothetical protein [Butyrivibrio proteoclasticus]|uniref:hypothetical protein n=1 Tax=Butyrivibrio proteoclasticus TaxID=43305 RepID=UPI00068729B2|nr:hypothetical protein [Butyrivibrio proteoclasticus]